MTTGTIALIDYLRKIELELDDDWLRQMVQNFTQAVIELEAEQQIGASRHERSAGRTTQRPGRLARIGTDQRAHAARPARRAPRRL